MNHQALKRILPDCMADALDNLDLTKIYEIRIRENAPVFVSCRNTDCYLTEQGLNINAEHAFVISSQQLQTVFMRACEFSVYAFNEQIKSGYITISEGIRIGICGECVTEGQTVTTIKNITSINIRIPNEIKGCADIALQNICVNDKVKNTLVISPPGIGKTTLLRDICRQLSQKYHKNVLIVDERKEFSATNNSTSSLKNCDILSLCSKVFGFSMGVRSMSPDIIVCDELSSAEDFENARRAASCGVNVIASIHAASAEDLLNKAELSSAIKDGIFERFILLSDAKGRGTYEAIYDKEFKLLYAYH